MNEPAFKQQAHGYENKHQQKHNEDHVLVFTIDSVTFFIFSINTFLFYIFAD